MAKRETTDTIVIHCTQTPPGMDVDVDKVTQWHKERGFDTIGYHYLIKRDGTLQEGRQQDEVGAHAVAVNGTSVGVALAGGGTPSGGGQVIKTDDSIGMDGYERRAPCLSPCAHLESLRSAAYMEQDVHTIA